MPFLLVTLGTVDEATSDLIEWRDFGPVTSPCQAIGP